MKTAMHQRSAAKRTPATLHLEVGSQLFHNGFPVQLLYRINQEGQHETWRVRPLFVDGPDRNERFQQSDSVSYLHTMWAPRWSCAAATFPISFAPEGVKPSAGGLV
jgi:hypothetical protein